MAAIEHRTSPVQSNELDSLNVPPEDDTHLGALLALRTKDRAHVVVRQHDRKPGLEQFRALAQHFEPDTDARDVDDIRVIIQPPAASSMDDTSRAG